MKSATCFGKWLILFGEVGVTEGRTTPLRSWLGLFVVGAKCCVGARCCRAREVVSRALVAMWLNWSHDRGRGGGLLGCRWVYGVASQVAFDLTQRGFVYWVGVFQGCDLGFDVGDLGHDYGFDVWGGCWAGT